MPRPGRLLLANDRILPFFAKAPQKIYSEAELRGVLLSQRASWQLAKSTSLSDFLDFLEAHGELQAHELRAKAYGRSVTRYSWGKPSPFELGQSIKSRGYLCHATALILHGLAEHAAKTIYVNVEQSPKPPSSTPPTQEGITRAFSSQQRQSNMIYAGSGISVVLLNGKNTKQFGIQELIGPASERLQVTDLERTLIDVVVRPAYAGGPAQVLKAYRAAKDRVSIDRLLLTLKKLNHAYPYHQSIGFLMQTAGYPEASYAPLKALGLQHDFYLAHGLRQPEHSEEWRLHYPKGLRA